MLAVLLSHINSAVLTTRVLLVDVGFCHKVFHCGPIRNTVTKLCTKTPPCSDTRHLDKIITYIIVVIIIIGNKLWSELFLINITISMKHFIFYSQDEISEVQVAQIN